MSSRISSAAIAAAIRSLTERANRFAESAKSSVELPAGRYDVLATHGPELIGLIHDSIQLDCPDHRLMVV